MLTVEHERAQAGAGELTERRSTTRPRGNAHHHRHCHETAPAARGTRRPPQPGAVLGHGPGHAEQWALVRHSQSNDGCISVKLLETTSSTRPCPHCTSVEVPLTLRLPLGKDLSPNLPYKAPWGPPPPPSRLPSFAPLLCLGPLHQGLGRQEAASWREEPCMNPGVSQASAGRSRPGGLDSALAPHGGRGPGQVCLRAQSHWLRFS